MWNASSVAHVKLKDVVFSIEHSLWELAMWCTEDNVIDGKGLLLFLTVNVILLISLV